MIIILFVLLGILLGLYSQTSYIGSSQWIINKLNYSDESWFKHIFAYLLRFWPFYHGRDFKDVRFFTISVYTGSWKKLGTGIQVSKVRTRGDLENCHKSSWLGIHLAHLVIELHFSWDHQGYKWYRKGGNGWRSFG